MAEKLFRMLRKNGTGLPVFYHPSMAQEPDMIECKMTKKEIDDAVKSLERKSPLSFSEIETEEEVEADPRNEEKPGPGYVKNSKGKWTKAEVTA